MRTIPVLVTSVALALSGLVLSPASATIPTNGTYDCTTGLEDSNYQNGWNYRIINGAVTDASGCDGEVKIAEGAISISDNAFTYSSDDGFFGHPPLLTSIAIPSSVTEIGSGVFDGATWLTKVTFAPSSNLHEIGDFAFHDASRLTKMNIPPGVSTIGAFAFSDASSLTSISIPASVTSIGEWAFNETRRLAIVTFAPGSRLKVIRQKTFMNASALSSIRIPASVTAIGESAFEGNYGAESKLAKVTFASGSKLHSIGDWAFDNAPIASITLPASVAHIGAFAFAGTRIEKITIPANLNYIGSLALPEPTKQGYKFGDWWGEGKRVSSSAHRFHLKHPLVLKIKWIRN